MAKKIGIATVFGKTKNLTIYCMDYLEKYVFVFFFFTFYFRFVIHILWAGKNTVDWQININVQ